MSVSSSGLRRSHSTMPTRTTTAMPASGSHSCQSFGISERADAADAHFDYVASSQRAHARGRAGGDHVAGFERHHLCDEADYNINGKDHFRRVSRLFPDSVLIGFDGGAGGSELRFEDGAEGAECVEAFAAGELAIESLQVTGGDFVEAGVAEDVGGGGFVVF